MSTLKPDSFDETEKLIKKNKQQHNNLGGLGAAEVRGLTNVDGVCA